MRVTIAFVATLALAIAGVVVGSSPAFAQSSIVEAGKLVVLRSVTEPDAALVTSEAPRSGWASVVPYAEATFVASQLFAIEGARRARDQGTDRPLSLKETIGLRAFLTMNALISSARSRDQHPKSTAILLFVASAVDVGFASRHYRVTVTVRR